MRPGAVRLCTLLMWPDNERIAARSVSDVNDTERPPQPTITDARHYDAGRLTIAELYVGCGDGGCKCRAADSIARRADERDDAVLG